MGWAIKTNRWWATHRPLGHTLGQSRSPSAQRKGIFGYFRLKAPTVGFALEKSSSQVSFGAAKPPLKKIRLHELVKLLSESFRPLPNPLLPRRGD